MHRYVVFDVETTGLFPAKGDRVIEIGAVAIEGQNITDEFQSLVSPGRPIPKAVQNIHGIGDEMLAEEPRPEQVIPVFYSFIGTSTLVAHNAGFDVSFIRCEFERLSLHLTNSHLCTLRITRKLLPALPNYKLETVYRHLFGYHQIEFRRHRALDDARMTADIWLELQRSASISS